jgi:hypothetical protein
VSGGKVDGRRGLDRRDTRGETVGGVGLCREGLQRLIDPDADLGSGRHLPV